MSLATLARPRGAYEHLDSAPAPEPRKEGDSYFAPFRFYVKQGKQTRIVFLDDEPWGVREHNLKIDGKWGNHFTCLAEAEGKECPLCKAGDKPSLSFFWTVMEKVTFTTSKGKEIVNPIRVLAAKDVTARLIRKYAAKFGSLVGHEFDVERSTADKSPAVGDQWVHEEKHSKKELIALLGENRLFEIGNAENPKGVLVDWGSYLAPKPEGELKKLIKTEAKASTKDEDAVDYD